MAASLKPSKLTFGDLVRTATIGIRTRKRRSALSALGIMIGIAAMVAVLGLSQSSKSELLAQLERLGTNLLTVEPSEGLGQGSGTLPGTATDMIARIGPIEATSMLSAVPAYVYRSDLVPTAKTGGISIQAVDRDLIAVLGGSLADGVWFDDEAKAAYPNVVLGAIAAERLGVHTVSGVQTAHWRHRRVTAGGQGCKSVAHRSAAHDMIERVREMKRILQTVIIVVLLISACSRAKNGETATPTATATMVTPVAPTCTPYPTYTSQPTYTPRPTGTSRPTDTSPPTLTATVEPTATAEPTVPPQEPTTTASPTTPPTITPVPQKGTAPTIPATQASAVELARIEDTDPGPPLTIQVSTVRIKGNGTYKLTGLVRNDSADGNNPGEIYGGVGVIVTFFTGAKPPNHHGPVGVYAACPLLAPGEACPFSLEIYPRNYVAYHLHPKGAPVEYHRPASLALSGLSVTNDNFGYVHITGTATNGNPFAVRDAYIFGTLIDAGGHIASVGMTLAPGEIVPGASVAFDLRIEQVPYVRYEVQAQATQN